MTAIAILTMALVCGVVWGGFFLLLVHALRRESRKRRSDEP